MPTQKKIEIAKNLKDQFEKASAYVFVDFRGLSVAGLTQLRRSLEKLGASLSVAKNTLIEKAFNIKNDGPTAIVFAKENALPTLKALVESAKTLTTLKIKSGFFEGQSYNGDQIVEIANLPAREVLLGKIAGTLISPLYRLATALTENQRKLVIVLNEIARR